jgi:outer membrane protein OmpA-like peptidoglycan-associated protein
MKRMTKIAMLAGVVLSAGCGGLPERVDSLEQARQSVRSVEQERLASQVAAEQLRAAREALSDADRAYQAGESLALIEHKAYIAQRNADISRELIAEAEGRQEIQNGEVERNRVIAEARTREAEGRARQAAALVSEAELAASAAEARAREADAARERNAELERQLQDLQARQTDRGLVLTLGDVLFDTSQADLKPGAASTIDRLAQFMQDYPDRAVRIEGHTDSRGSDELNQTLSERRANAVRDALLDRGVAATRIVAVGMGERYPVASNETAAGMQQNRRVEIVISDEGGVFAGGAQRASN